jgi:hypothetical protein
MQCRRGWLPYLRRRAVDSLEGVPQLTLAHVPAAAATAARRVNWTHKPNIDQHRHFNKTWEGWVKLGTRRDLAMINAGQSGLPCASSSAGHNLKLQAVQHSHSHELKHTHRVRNMMRQAETETHLIICSADRTSDAPSRCSTASPRASSGSQCRVRWCMPRRVGCASSSCRAGAAGVPTAAALAPASAVPSWLDCSCGIGCDAAASSAAACGFS